MADKKSFSEAADELSMSVKQLKHELGKVFLDPVTRPIFQYLAFKQTITQIKCVIPPKHQTQIKLVRKLGKSLPRDLRGAYIHLVQDKVVSGHKLPEAAGQAITDIINFINEPKEINHAK